MLFVGTSIIHPSTEGVFLLCNILDLLIYRYKNHFFFNVSKQKDSGLFFSTYHPFTSFVIFDKSEFSCVRTMPISADEFCELLTSYGVEYAESK